MPNSKCFPEAAQNDDIQFLAEAIMRVRAYLPCVPGRPPASGRPGVQTTPFCCSPAYAKWRGLRDQP
jgi:hypothetical protein